jgi:hypothetical protein
VQNEKARLELRRASIPMSVLPGSEHRPSHMGAMMAMVMPRDGVLHKALAYHIQLQ